MSNTSFAEAILTAVTYFTRLEAVQFANADLVAFQTGGDPPVPHSYDFIVGKFKIHAVDIIYL